MKADVGPIAIRMIELLMISTGQYVAVNAAWLQRPDNPEVQVMCTQVYPKPQLLGTTPLGIVIECATYDL